MDIRKAITIVEGALREAAAPQLADVIATIAKGWGVTFGLAETEQGIEIRGGSKGVHPTDYLHALRMLCHCADTMGKPLIATVPLPDYGVLQSMSWLGFEKVGTPAPRTALVRRDPRAPGDAPQAPPGPDGWPQGIFYLPTQVIGFFDDPTQSLGDDGWDIDRLVAAIRKDGEIKNPIEVGRSLADLMQRGDTSVNAFNGNHRLAAAKKLGIEFMACENSPADDADPLSKQDIIALGGRLS